MVRIWILSLVGGWLCASCAARQHLGPSNGDGLRAIFDSQKQGEEIGADGVRSSAAAKKYRDSAMKNDGAAAQTPSRGFTLRSR